MDMTERIQNLRKQNGLSQEELAEKLNVSRQAVSKWESNQSTPDLDKIVAMSELFDVTTDYLIKGVEAPNAMSGKSLKTLYISLAAIFATVLGLWAATANRFRYIEIILIIAAGALIGFGVAVVIKTVLSLSKSK